MKHRYSIEIKCDGKTAMEANVSLNTAWQLVKLVNDIEEVTLNEKDK